MKCHLYLQFAGGAARRVGPIDVADEAQARQLAQSQLQSHPDVLAVDVWWDTGELYRIERPASPSPLSGGDLNVVQGDFRGGPERRASFK